jgi:hypothetical protein
MFRLLEFIEHGHRIILHGDPALALGIDQKLVAAAAAKTGEKFAKFRIYAVEGLPPQ